MSATMNPPTNMVQPQAPIGAAAPVTNGTAIKGYTDYVVVIIMSAYLYVAKNYRRAVKPVAIAVVAYAVLRCMVGMFALLSYGESVTASKVVAVSWELDIGESWSVRNWYHRGKLDRAFSIAPEEVDRFKSVL